MVGDLRGIEYALGLLQRLATNGFDEFRIDGFAEELGLIEAVQGLRTLGVDIIREILRVDTRIGGVFLLVERLDNVQRHLCRVAELTITVYLQRGKVVELRRLFLTFLLLDAGDGKGFALDGLEGLFALFLRSELTLRSRKRGVAIDGSQHPVGLGLEVVYFLLSVDDERQGGRLHSTN